LHPARPDLSGKADWRKPEESALRGNARFSDRAEQKRRRLTQYSPNFFEKQFSFRDAQGRERQKTSWRREKNAAP
jgi:hypothetical protein